MRPSLRPRETCPGVGPASRAGAGLGMQLASPALSPQVSVPQDSLASFIGMTALCVTAPFVRSWSCLGSALKCMDFTNLSSPGSDTDRASMPGGCVPPSEQRGSRCRGGDVVLVLPSLGLCVGQAEALSSRDDDPPTHGCGEHPDGYAEQAWPTPNT